MSYRHFGPVALIGMMALTGAIWINAQDTEKLTEEQMRDFLLNAKIVGSKTIPKGITNPYRLTLKNDTMTHDAGFQFADTYESQHKFWDGRVEWNFHDSYKYNLAAFELAKLVGLGDMMPVTVERKWQGHTGSLTWWLPSVMDEADRMNKKITPPDPEAWNKQMYKMRVFSQLVYDTDRNLQNVLISQDWHLWMIDFTRAFRVYDTLENAKNLVKCDRQLLQKLRQLDAAELKQKAGKWISSAEIKGVMSRRDKIVAFFDRLITEKGEAEVLYD